MSVGDALSHRCTFAYPNRSCTDMCETVWNSMWKSPSDSIIGSSRCGMRVKLMDFAPSVTEFYSFAIETIWQWVKTFDPHQFFVTCPPDDIYMEKVMSWKMKVRQKKNTRVWVFWERVNQNRSLTFWITMTFFFVHCIAKKSHNTWRKGKKIYITHNAWKLFQFGLTNAN